jgi:hypothetical protein
MEVAYLVASNIRKPFINNIPFTIPHPSTLFLSPPFFLLPPPSSLLPPPSSLLPPPSSLLPPPSSLLLPLPPPSSLLLTPSRIASWVTLVTENGHWKGRGSGDNTNFVCEEQDVFSLLPLFYPLPSLSFSLPLPPFPPSSLTFYRMLKTRPSTIPNNTCDSLPKLKSTSPLSSLSFLSFLPLPLPLPSIECQESRWIRRPEKKTTADTRDK